MPIPRSYTGVILGCCKAQITVETSASEEIALDAIGELQKNINCTKCQQVRNLKILRSGDNTKIMDISNSK